MNYFVETKGTVTDSISAFALWVTRICQTFDDSELVRQFSGDALELLRSSKHCVRGKFGNGVGEYEFRMQKVHGHMQYRGTVSYENISGKTLKKHGYLPNKTLKLRSVNIVGRLNISTILDVAQPATLISEERRYAITTFLGKHLGKWPGDK